MRRTKVRAAAMAEIAASQRFRTRSRGKWAGTGAARREILNAHAGAENGGEIGGGDGDHVGANGDGVRRGCGRKKEGKKKKRGPHLAAGREGRERERVEQLAVGFPSDGHGRAGRSGKRVGSGGKE